MDNKLKTRLPKPFATLPDDENVVAMAVHKGILVVASNKHVYTLSENGNLKRVMFEVECDE